MFEAFEMELNGCNIVQSFTADTNMVFYPTELLLTEFNNVWVQPSIDYDESFSVSPEPLFYDFEGPNQVVYP